MKGRFSEQNIMKIRMHLSWHLLVICFGIVAFFIAVQSSNRGFLVNFHDSMGLLIAASFAVLTIIFHYYVLYLHYRLAQCYLYHDEIETEETAYSHRRLYNLEELSYRAERLQRLTTVATFFEHMFLFVSLAGFLLAFMYLSFGKLLPNVMSKKYIVMPCSTSTIDPATLQVPVAPSLSTAIPTTGPIVSQLPAKKAADDDDDDE